MTELDHKTFDLGAVLSGITFPETEVDVYFDESVGFSVYQAEQTLRVAEIRGNETQLKEVLDNLEALKKKAADARFKITIRGVAESTRKTCDRKSRDKFPVEYTFMGTETPNPERDDYYNTLLWGVSILKIEDPSGAVALPTEEHILTLRNEVGRSTTATITDALKELIEGTKAGFESAAQDTSFLSGA